MNEEIEKTNQFNKTHKFVEINEKLSKIDLTNINLLKNNLESAQDDIFNFMKDISGLGDSEIITGQQAKILTNKVSKLAETVGNSNGILVGYISALFELGILWQECIQRVSLRFQLNAEKAEQALEEVYILLKM